MTKETIRISAFITGFLFLFSVIVLISKVVLFPVSVANTAVNSTNEVIDKTLKAYNVIHNYEWFYDVDAQIKAKINQISAHKELIKEETDKNESSRLKMELAAMKQICRNLAAKYNANSEKMNTSLFKSRGLVEHYALESCE